MCGRFAMALSVDETQRTLEQHGLTVGRVQNAEKVEPSLNKAPTSYSMIYRNNSQTNGKELVAMKWSLQPNWARKAVDYPTFNTRSESLSPLKSTWKCAASNRGILAFQGYYEWDCHEHNPYYFHGQSKLLFCLVIWDQNDALGSSPTYSIVTTKAAPYIQRIHPRMPVVVEKADVAKEWVQGKWPNVLTLIGSNENLQLYRVGNEISKPGVNSPGLNTPLKKKQASLNDFFASKSKPIPKNKLNGVASEPEAKKPRII